MCTDSLDLVIYYCVGYVIKSKNCGPMWSKVDNYSVQHVILNEKNISKPFHLQEFNKRKNPHILFSKKSHRDHKVHEIIQVTADYLIRKSTEVEA